MGSLAIYALVAILALGGAGVAGYSRGLDSARKDCEIARAASVARAIEQERATAAQDAEISEGFEKARTKIEIKYREVEKEVIREIPAGCAQCRLVPDALGMLNRAIAGDPGATPTDPGKLDQSMRPAKPPAGWDFPGAGREIGGIERKTL